MKGSLTIDDLSSCDCLLPPLCSWHSYTEHQLSSLTYAHLSLYNKYFSLKFFKQGYEDTFEARDFDGEYEVEARDYNDLDLEARYFGIAPGADEDLVERDFLDDEEELAAREVLDEILELDAREIEADAALEVRLFEELSALYGRAAERAAGGGGLGGGKGGRKRRHRHGRGKGRFGGKGRKHRKGRGKGRKHKRPAGGNAGAASAGVSEGGPAAGAPPAGADPAAAAAPADAAPAPEAAPDAAAAA